MSMISIKENNCKFQKELSDDESVHTTGTEVESVGSCGRQNENIQVFRIEGDSCSLLSQHDLSYADFSHVVDDEDNSMCSLLSYSSLRTESLTRTVSKTSLDSKIVANSGILSGTILITQITKEQLNANFDIKEKHLTETHQGKRTVSRINELQKKKRHIERQFISSKTICETIDENISNDELESVLLEKSIATSSRRLMMTAAVCLPLFPFLCGVLAA